jgi:hypothetical protein
MGITINNHPARRITMKLLVITALIFVFHYQLRAQEMPPRPVSVSVIRSMNFGAFSNGMTGGTVTVTPFGNRSSTGSIILIDMGYMYYPAAFEIEGNPGTILHLLNGPDEILTGSSGGTLSLHIGDSNAGDPIIINVAPPGGMEVRMGGTLTAGNPMANPPGLYNGSFTVLIVQE